MRSEFTLRGYRIEKKSYLVAPTILEQFDTRHLLMSKDMAPAARRPEPRAFANLEPPIWYNSLRGGPKLEPIMSSRCEVACRC